MIRSSKFSLVALILCAAVLLSSAAQQDLPRARTQDLISFGIDIRLNPLKMAVADFKTSAASGAASPDAVARVFNDTLWSDLNNAGIFTMVSKSFYPREIPGRPDELPADRMKTWAAPPTSSEALAFGNLTTNGDRLLVEGYLFDVTGKSQAPMILGKRYADEATPEASRVMAHRFANEIIKLLGGGLPGIAESKIYFVSNRTGTKEIWTMDYDGANQRQITRYNNLTITPAVSADGLKLAYASWYEGNPNIYLLALDTRRQLPFRNMGPHLHATPSFSADGTKMAFAGSRSVDTQIYISDPNGGNPVRITDTRGVSIEPKFNPKKGQQIAFVSGRAGNAQVYVMDIKGSGARRISGGGGDAVNPDWAPNGNLLAFSWTRGYAPGNYNIFVADVSSDKLVQLTYGAGKNEHPSWSPDGRHIVFASTRGGKQYQIYSMLADGTQVKALTSAGANEMPVWSSR